MFGLNKKIKATETRQTPSLPQTNKMRQISRQRNFEAAEITDAYASWTTSSIDPDQIIFKSLSVLRARSRQLAASSDMAASYIGLCEKHIIGDEGFKLRPKSRNKKGELDKTANDAIQKAWRYWSVDRHCDFKMKHDDASFDRLIERTVVVDGEAFVQEMNGDRFGISFRLYDPETVPVNYNVDNGKGKNYIRFGIEYDPNDKPVAYFFRDRNGQNYNLGYGGAGVLQLTRIPAAQIQHIYVQNMVDLRRGLPWMSASMIRFRMIGKFEDAAIKNAIVGASSVAVVSGEGSQDIVDDIEDSGARLIETDHVGLWQVDGEVKVDNIKSDFPSNEYSSFIKTNTMFLSAGVGVNYHSLSGDLSGVNYSSLKHGTTEEREHWKILQNWFISDWKRPQYFRWLKMALLVGIPVGDRGLLKPQDFIKYSEIEFFGRRWIGPDPLKEASANAVAIKSKTLSPQRVILERGNDPEEIFEELKVFYDTMHELDIPVEVGANMINVDMSEKEDAE